MASKKLVVVIGATGNQGGSVIKAILGDPKAAAQFSLRAITRDTTSKKAQALTAQGVECVKADLDAKEHLLPAFKDAYAVFGVTNFWEKASADIEIAQGKNIADAAKESGVQHLVFSSLLNVTKLTNGAFSDVKHFDSKATIEEYIRASGVPATFVLPGFYMSNLPGSTLRKSADGTWGMTVPFTPTTQLPLFDAEADTGKFVKAVLLKRDAVLGKRVLEATAYYTPGEVISTFQKVYPNAGKGATYTHISGDEFKKGLLGMGMGEVVAQELTQNFTFMPQYGYYGGASLDESLALLDEKPTTWEEFVKKAPAFSELD